MSKQECKKGKYLAKKHATEYQGLNIITSIILSKNIRYYNISPLTNLILFNTMTVNSLIFNKYNLKTSRLNLLVMLPTY
ncbi:hypothetical protein [Citrobacter braakii]|uniref:hypothetical protein n=1 Tax=Citrobacter braakii TaxID=57706 RepID=UPI0025412D1E|nr:hypothetical protein [Citrobacter braakii]WIF77649.1 hypothetical protein QN090_05985 [Citrobacter braakii]